MNILFAVVFLVCAAFLLVLRPESFLSVLLGASAKSATLCVSLLSTYAVWLGLMNVWQQSGVSRAVSHRLRPLAKRVFLTDDDATLDAVCMNLSVNLLGISGAATPYGIEAARLLDASPQAEYASSMLFVLNATSIQLIPASIVGIRVSLGSVAPADIILPTLITTVFSTLVGVLLTRFLIPPRTEKTGGYAYKILKTKGAGI